MFFLSPRKRAQRQRKVLSHSRIGRLLSCAYIPDIVLVQVIFAIFSHTIQDYNFHKYKRHITQQRQGGLVLPSDRCLKLKSLGI
jgi:hypothetical protein